MLKYKRVDIFQQKMYLVQKMHLKQKQNGLNLAFMK